MIVTVDKVLQNIEIFSCVFSRDVVPHSGLESPVKTLHNTSFRFLVMSCEEMNLFVFQSFLKKLVNKVRAFVGLKCFWRPFAFFQNVCKTLHQTFSSFLL